MSPFDTYSRTSQYLSPLQSSTHHQSARRVKKLKRNSSPVREKNEIRLEQLKESTRANRFDVRKYKNEFFTDCDVQYHSYLKIPLLSAIVDSIMAKHIHFAGESKRT